MGIPNEFDIMGNFDSLPSGYKRCEYLESTGTQYILFSPLIITKNDVISITFQRLGSETDKWLFGQRNDNDVQFGLGRGWNDTAWGVCRGYACRYLKATDDFLKCQINISLDGIFIDSVWYQFVTANNYTDGFYYGDSSRWSDTINLNSVGLFCLYKNGTPQYMSTAKIFSFSIKNKINFIPALCPHDKDGNLTPNGTPCMYDTLSRKPFFNSGTGEFSYKLK